MHVFPLEPAAAHTAGPLINYSNPIVLNYCYKGALTPSWDEVRTCVRAYLRVYGRTCVTLEKLFTPYLVVEQSPSAKIWCLHVTSINDGAQILAFPGFNNNRDFQNSIFQRGFDCFKFGMALIVGYLQIDHICYIYFPKCAPIVTPKELSQ